MYLTEDDCQRFINEYEGWSKTFASKVRMVLRRILTKAEKQELIKTSVAKDIVLPTVYENKHRPITDDERRMILETIPKHSTAAIFKWFIHKATKHISIFVP